MEEIIKPGEFILTGNGEEYLAMGGKLPKGTFLNGRGKHAGGKVKVKKERKKKPKSFGKRK